jgi:tetratricopeptide (TPR) repeat protein
MTSGPGDELRSLIEREQVLAIVGAGVSIGATGGEPVASWIGLLEHGVDYCRQWAHKDEDWGEIVRRELARKDGESLLSAATKIETTLEAPGGGLFRKWLRDSVGALKVVDRGVIEALHALGVPMATTNYDGLIEEITGLPPVTWKQAHEVERVLRGEGPGVLHLHGHWETPETVVLGYRSYEEVVRDPHAQAMLRAILATRTVLFVGCGGGLSDPNFGKLLDWARETLAGSVYPHVRLALDAERAELLKEHPVGGPIHVLPFGARHDDLDPFLRGLAPPPPPPPDPPPPPPTLPIAPLPAKPACFGRDEEVKDLVRTLLRKVPPPTPVLGGPGMGKTTMTLAALHDPGVAKRYGARRFFVRCDPARTRDEAVALVANAVGVPLGPDREPRLLAELASRPAVLVLDNLETPWEHDPAPTEDLLGRLDALPGLALVASVRGQDWPAGTWREPIRVEPLTPDAARAAFFAVSGKAKFAVDPRLEDLLEAVDYVPLAVVLLAHYARPEPDLTAVWQQWQAQRADLLRRLGGDDRLTSFAVSVEISLSGRRMTDDARRLLRLLGVLPDGIARSGLDAVLPGAGVRAAHTLRALGLAYDEAGRLRVLAPIRHYIRDHHPPTPSELASVLRYYGHLLLTEAEKAEAGSGFVDIARMSTGLANFEVICLICLGLPDSAGTALPLFPREGSMPGQVALIIILGYIALERSDLVAARARYEEALTLYAREGDVLGQANCIWRLGDIALARSDHEQARARYEEALPLYLRVGSVLGQANCIQGLGYLALRRSDHEQARAKFEEALALYGRIQEPYSIGWAHVRLARIAPDADARVRHARATREAWRRIGREDLIEKHLGEFGDLD